MKMSSPACGRSSQAPSADATPLVEVYSRLRSQLTHLSQLLDMTTSSADLLIDIKTLDSRITAYDKSAARATTAEKGKVPKWEDELDRAGTRLWNKSTALRHAAEQGSEGTADAKALEVVAELRRAGYRLIRLGSLLPLTPDSHLSLLTLATKTSLALLAVNQFSSADALVKEAGAHAAQLERFASTDPTVLKERGHALVAFYCCRIRVSIAGNDGLGGWLRSRAEHLVKSGSVTWREVEKLAKMAYDVGAAELNKVRDASPPVDEEGDDAGDAVEWLQFALELLESGEGVLVKDQQLAVMKALAEAYIVEKRWSEAEEALKQILAIKPSSELRRRQIKLLLSRGAGDGELVAAFAAAASAELETEEGSKLIALVAKIPEERRILRFNILKTIIESAKVSSPPTGAQREFLNQIFATAIFLLDGSDRTRLQNLLETATKAIPAAQLASTTSFLCITYIWRQGDHAHVDGHYIEASEWFLLATHPLFSLIDPVVSAKTIRKAALSLIEARENARAEQVLHLPAAGGDYAKTHFVRFYNYSMLNQTRKSAAALEAVVTAPDFSPQLLLWAAKTANEADNKELLAAVLQKLVDVCKSGIGLAGVDLMVVIRCLIRLSMVKVDEANEAEALDFVRMLHSHLDAALVLARDLVKANPVPESLNKDLAWLYKSSFNLCARFSAHWPLDLLVSVYSLIASLIELEVALGLSTVDSVVIGKLWVCKFAALSGQVEEARKASGAEQIKLYKALVSSTTSFIDGLTSASSSSSAPSPPVEKADALLDAAYAVKIEALAATQNWKGLEKLVEDFEGSSRLFPVSLLKLAVDKATSSTTCPREELCSILKKTLVLLYSRQDLDVASMARWLRMIISALLDKQPEEALEYVKNAAELIKANLDEYPQEEIDWLIPTAWDYGVDAYTALLTPLGQLWCDQAVKVAEAAGKKRVGRMVEQLEGWHESLKERFGGVGRSEDGDVEMA